MNMLATGCYKIAWFQCQETTLQMLGMFSVKGAMLLAPFTCFFFLFLLFWLSWQLLCRPGQPLTERPICLSLLSPQSKGMCHHTRLFCPFNERYFKNHVDRSIWDSSIFAALTVLVFPCYRTSFSSPTISSLNYFVVEQMLEHGLLPHVLCTLNLPFLNLHDPFFNQYNCCLKTSFYLIQSYRSQRRKKTLCFQCVWEQVRNSGITQCRAHVEAYHCMDMHL